MRRLTENDNREEHLEVKIEKELCHPFQGADNYRSRQLAQESTHETKDFITTIILTLYILVD